MLFLLWAFAGSGRRQAPLRTLLRLCRASAVRSSYGAQMTCRGYLRDTRSNCAEGKNHFGAVRDIAADPGTRR